ncbi:MAG TPA: AAA family ATPase, partial [Acidimicrobiales bacterium]|nr:AAA family ATPase [Acidimicrobiales bacterium]
MGGVAAPFVGRMAEQEVVAKAILEVESGRCAVVVIEGEAGIGKTRLVDEVAATLSPGITVRRAVAQELERNRPFGAVADALGVDLRSPDPDRAGIARLLWAPPGGPSGDAVSVAAGPGLHYRVVEALLLLIEMRARTGPLLVTIEDLQWCDPSSLLTLSSVRRRLRHLPVALLLTRRPTPQSVEIQPALDGLLADGGRHLVLGPLDGPDTEALAQAVSGYPPGETLRRQLPRARGNPLLIIELLRALQFEDALVIEDGRAELSHSDLPARLHVMLLRRLSYLGKDALELLRLAAVLGPSFEVGHLAAVARRSVVELLPLLDEAVAAGVFGDSGARLVFRHDLIREAIYNDVPPAIRRGLHREVGEALAAAGAPAVQVAEHLSLGATPGDTRAVRWLHRAGRDTMARAPGEAVALLERAVELAPHDHDDRAAILADLALATLWAGRLPEAEKAARALLAHGHHTDIDGGVRLVLIMALLGQGRSFEATTEAAIGVSQPGLPPRARAQLWAYAAYGPLFTGDLDTASARAEEARAEGVRLDDPVSESVALNALGMVATLQGRVAEGVGLAGEALDCADRMPGNTAHRWHASMTLAVSMMDADRFAEAENVLGEGRRRCEDFGVRWPVPLYQWGVVWHSFRTGAWDAALSKAQSGFALIEEVPFRFGAVSAHAVVAMIAVRRNDLLAAESALAAADAELARTGPQYLYEWRPWAAALVTEALG